MTAIPIPEALAADGFDDGEHVVGGEGCRKCGTCKGDDRCADPSEPLNVDRGDCPECEACVECIARCAALRKAPEPAPPAVPDRPADDPNTKAHAYIRALERQLEEAQEKLAATRAYLVWSIQRERAAEEIEPDDNLKLESHNRREFHESALRALDGADETRETDGGGSGE